MACAGWARRGFRKLALTGTAHPAVLQLVKGGFPGPRPMQCLQRLLEAYGRDHRAQCQDVQLIWVSRPSLAPVIALDEPTVDISDRHLIDRKSDTGPVRREVSNDCPVAIPDVGIKRFRKKRDVIRRNATELGALPTPIGRLENGQQIRRKSLPCYLPVSDRGFIDRALRDVAQLGADPILMRHSSSAYPRNRD